MSWYVYVLIFTPIPQSKFLFLAVLSLFTNAYLASCISWISIPPNQPWEFPQPCGVGSYFKHKVQPHKYMFLSALLSKWRYCYQIYFEHQAHPSIQEQYVFILCQIPLWVMTILVAFLCQASSFSSFILIFSLLSSHKHWLQRVDFELINFLFRSW